MTNPYEGSVAVDAASQFTFGGDVRTVLDTARSQPAPPTLEEARQAAR